MFCPFYFLAGYGWNIDKLISFILKIIIYVWATAYGILVPQPHIKPWGWTQASCSGNGALTTGLPGHSLDKLF